MKRDPGLQPERTAIAWSRTCFALVVDAALVVRFGIEPWSGVMLALGCLMLLAAAVFLCLSLHRRAVLLHPRPRPAAPPASFMGVSVACIGCVCLVEAMAIAWK